MVVQNHFLGSRNISSSNAWWSLVTTTNNNVWSSTHCTDPTFLPFQNYQNIYAGVAWGGLVAGQTTNIHTAHSLSPNYSIGCDVLLDTLGGVTVTMWRGQMASNGVITRIVYSSNTNPLTITGPVVTVAWFWNTKVGQENTSRILINNIPVNITANPGDTAVNISLPYTYLWLPGTVAGTKLNSVWTTFNTSFNSNTLVWVNDNWGKYSPVFLGRHGEYPIGEPAQCYFNSNDQLGIKNYAIGAGFTNVSQLSVARAIARIALPGA